MRESIVNYLFEDVKRLPILTKQAQELWLGIQIKAPEHWQALLRVDGCGADVGLLAIYASLYANRQHLEKSCEKLEISPPNLSRWIEELLLVRKNIYELRRSRLRNFVKRLSNLEKNLDEIDLLTDLLYKVAELLSLLPNEVLYHIGELERLPLPEVLEKWMTQTSLEFKPLRQMAMQQARKAQHTLVTGHLRYALRGARKHINQGVPYLDLVQVACLGLIYAAERFDYREQTRFVSYASTWMWQRINRTIANQSRAIRVPVHTQTQIQEIQAAYEQLWEEKRREPTFDELLFLSDGMAPNDIECIKKCYTKGEALPTEVKQRYRKAAKALRLRLVSSQAILSLEDVFENTEGALISRSDCLAQDLLGHMARSLVMKKVYSLLTSFSERYQKIFKMRFGLDTGEDHTLTEVGEAFDLTRERIRQIETRILDYLAGGISEQLIVDCLTPPIWPLVSHNESLVTRDLFSNHEQIESQDWGWLDDLIDELPGGDWHQTQQGSTREEQLVEALQALQEPAHYSDITDQLNGMLERESLEEKYVYALLFKHEDSFALLGEGVFSLATWEKERTKQSTPDLPFCPTTLPHNLERDQVFLESILVAAEMLQQKLTVSNFLERMLTWAGVSEPQTTWGLQSVLSAYYLVGVIPYYFYPDAKEEIIELTLPKMELQELRKYCLQTMTQRLVAMPEFWWLMQRYEPARACDIAEHFIDVHPLGLDDTLNRLELLTSIGAAQKSKYARFRLTGLGQELADSLGLSSFSSLGHEYYELGEEDYGNDELYDIILL